MKTACKYIVLSIIALQYLFGSIGFTIHHCCCTKLYHTTSILCEGFSPYHIHDCKMIQETENSRGKLVYLPSRHCGSFSYSMEHMKYNCQKQVDAPPLFLVLIEDFSLALKKDITLLSAALETPLSSLLCDNHLLKRRWQEPDSLCLFLI